MLCPFIEISKTYNLFKDNKEITRCIFNIADSMGETYLGGFSLYITNSTTISGQTPDYSNTDGYGDGIFNVTPSSPKFARYVYITLPNTGVLSLCEVRVLGGLFLPNIAL